MVTVRTLQPRRDGFTWIRDVDGLPIYQRCDIADGICVCIDDSKVLVTVRGIEDVTASVARAWLDDVARAVEIAEHVNGDR